ncbi:uncharacterized protein METZ01_LOCUS55665 [marine metagenome]|uniref:Uncharacterized protein n=1 Tax=marine metagenome TaxID=408172 RepID=A0A381SHL1_9ZZZZ
MRQERNQHRNPSAGNQLGLAADLVWCEQQCE